LKKNADPSLPQNYRIISVTSLISRLHEHMFHSRLFSHLNNNDFFTRFQFGFLPGCNTYDNIHIALHQIKKALSNHEDYTGVFIDINKAFDSVWLDGLLHKLSQARVPLYMTKWLHSFLYNRSFFLSHSQCSSTPIFTSRGVPQGCILSPLLFLVYINDLASLFHSLPVDFLLYADDIFLGLCSDSGRSNLRHDILQTAINLLVEWCLDWGLCVSSTKSKALLFSTRRDHEKYNQVKSACTLLIQNIKLEFVDTFCHLGLLLDRKLDWKPQISRLKRSLFMSSFSICRFFAPLSPSFPPLSSLALVLRQLILPKIAYGLAFINISQEDEHSLNMILASSIRSILKIPKRCCNTLLLLSDFKFPDIISLQASAINSLANRFSQQHPKHPTRVCFDERSSVLFPAEKFWFLRDRWNNLFTKILPTDCRPLLSVFENKFLVSAIHISNERLLLHPRTSHSFSVEAYCKIAASNFDNNHISSKIPLFFSSDPPFLARLRLVLRLCHDSAFYILFSSNRDDPCPLCQKRPTSENQSLHLLTGCAATHKALLLLKAAFCDPKLEGLHSYPLHGCLLGFDEPLLSVSRPFLFSLHRLISNYHS
jgi:hypothetical protein